MKERKCLKCEALLGKKGQCRDCGVALCPNKKCHLEHRAATPARFPAYRVLPPTCENQRQKIDQRANNAAAALLAAQQKHDALRSKLTVAPDNMNVVKQLVCDLMTAERVVAQRMEDYAKLAFVADAAYAEAV